MNRSLTIPGFVVLVAVFVLAASACYAGEQPPNILFIFADDQCFETIHALGNERSRRRISIAWSARASLSRTPTTWVPGTERSAWPAARCSTPAVSCGAARQWNLA